MISLFKRTGINRKSLRRLLKPGWFYLISKSLKPLSHNYGASRGTPLDRYYIESFLAENSQHIKGRCLEVKDNNYTKKFGGSNVSKSDILDIDKSNASATIYGDLRNAVNITDDSFDCIILTQVLQFVNDVPAVIKECFRILKPNGCLLITAPSISRIDVRAGVTGDFWRFTTKGLEYLLKKSFAPEKTETKSLGNVLSGVGFWVGQALEEFSKKELDHNDLNFPVIITAKVFK